MYICRDCNAYVGCYRDTNKALGRLADSELRHLCHNIDSVGKAMVMKGIGIHSSFTHCWALTHYGRSFHLPWFESDEVMSILSDSEKMIAAGLKKIKDREIAAECHKVLEQWRIIAEKYSDTNVGRDILARCDRLRDYALKKAEKNEK